MHVVLENIVPAMQNENSKNKKKRKMGFKLYFPWWKSWAWELVGYIQNLSDFHVKLSDGEQDELFMDNKNRED